MEVSAINLTSPVTLTKVYEILTSDKISQAKKTEFLRQNKTEIQQAINVKLSGTDFKGLMQTRPLQKFRPLKNSFTKRGDKILLGKTLGIEPSEVDNYIKNVQESLSDIGKLGFLPKDKLDAIKTYVYRHGSIDGITVFLDYELKTSEDIIKTLYRTLEYHTGGLADYFIRPIHRMTNNTMIRLYNVIDKNIKTARSSNLINTEQSDEIAQWALIRIYRLQNNTKLINAIKTYNVLKQ